MPTPTKTLIEQIERAIEIRLANGEAGTIRPLQAELSRLRRKSAGKVH